MPRRNQHPGTAGSQQSADPSSLEACPILTGAFALLGKRWTGLILDVLVRQPARFSEIHHAIPGLSDRVLGERLQELETAGIIEHAPAEPTRYQLTAAGQLLAPALDALRSAWLGVREVQQSEPQ